MRKLLLALSLVILPALGVGAVPVRADTSGVAIVQTALRYLGYPYTTVGNSPSAGFSCIGFVSYVYQSNGVPLPDDLWDAQAYSPAISFSDLLPGDVLYFANTVWPGLSHTGIYLGGGRFINAEWYNRGVVISSFTNDPVDGNYWSEHYLGANRPWAGVVAAAPSPPVSSTAPSPAPAIIRPAPAAPRVPALRVGPHARVQVLALNVRVRPSLGAPVARLVRHGTGVVILKQYGLWDWVEFSNRTYGWIAGTGLSVAGSVAGTTPTFTRLAAQPIALNEPTVNGLRVHVRPGLAAAIVTALYRGQKLLVLQRWSNWARVQTASGRRGWVDSSFLSSPSTARRVLPAAHTVTTAHASGLALSVTVRLHAKPGLTAPVLRLAAQGTKVKVLNVSGTWAHVKLSSGGTGWVYSSFVR